MKLIINTTTLSASGVSQVAVSFINECKKYKNNEYYVFLSKMLKSQINKENFPNNFFFYEFENHPLYGIKGYKIRCKLEEEESRISPDCVFSVFGPSWWTPKAPHLQGFGYGHYVYSDSPFFKYTSLKLKLKFLLFKRIHSFFLKRNGCFFVSETEDVSIRLKNNLRKGDYFTVGNTYSAVFNNFIPDYNLMLPSKKKKSFRFLSLCTFDDHKNLTILNQVIPLLNTISKEVDIKFILTIEDEIFDKKFNIEAKKRIINLGRIDISKCPQLYYECDALFLPTTIECFTANYPEAMKMKKPIITSNLSFATSICKGAAMYFNPYEPTEIVDVIINLIFDENERERLIEKSQKVLLSFISPEERAREYLKICKNISTRN